MSYNKITSFAVKDTMADSNPLKVVRGKEFDDEFDAIAAAVTAQEALLAALVTTPTGGVMMFAGATAPTDFLLCDGAAKSRSTYAALFQIIGTTFGAGDGGTTFNVPNLVERFPYGASSGQLGWNGGSADSTLPSHSHTASTSTWINDPGHNHGAGSHGIDGNQYGSMAGINQRLYGYGNAAYGAYQQLTSSSSTGISAGSSTTVNSAGGSAVNTNLPPFLRMNFIIKT